jgi:uncharacterized low-complexity protein
MHEARLYRDVLGMPERLSYSSAEVRLAIVEAGRATLELADPPHAAFVDQVEVGRRVAGHIRVALQVADTSEATRPAFQGRSAPDRRADGHAVEVAKCSPRGSRRATTDAVRGACGASLTHPAAKEGRMSARQQSCHQRGEPQPPERLVGCRCRAEEGPIGWVPRLETKSSVAFRSLSM